MKTTRIWTVVAGTLAAAILLSGCQNDHELKVNKAAAAIDARTALLRAAESGDPVVRANALEAMPQTLGVEAGNVYVQSLRDQFPVVRYAAAIAIGQTRYQPALDELRAMAQSANKQVGERDKRVFAGVIYALHELGDDQYTSELGSLLFDQEEEVSAAAAQVMGLMREPSATAPLKSLLQQQRHPKVELQAVESLAMLGDEGSAMRLEAYTRRVFVDERLVAIPALAATRSPRAPYVLKTLFDRDQPARVKVAAATGLAQLGQARNEHYRFVDLAARDPREAIEVEVRHRQVSDEELASLQQLAAKGLWQFCREESLDTLHPLLQCDNGSTRVAAAQSILRLLPDMPRQPPVAQVEPTPLVIPAAPVEAQPQPVEPTQVAPEQPAATPAVVPEVPPAPAPEAVEPAATPAVPPAVDTPATPATPVTVVIEPATPQTPTPAPAPAADPSDPPAPQQPQTQPGDADDIGQAIEPATDVVAPKLHTSGGRD